MMETEILYPGKLIINDVRVVKNTSALDITDAFSSLVIEEDIEAGFITGYIVFTDADFLSADDTFDGNEKVTVSFYSINENAQPAAEYNKTFQVIGVIINNDTVTGNTRTIKLTFVSEPAVKNDIVRLRRSYTHMSTAQIVNHCLDVINVKTPRSIEDTLHQQTVIAPNITPLELIDWMKEISIGSELRGSDFYFFENVRGVHFVSQEQMIKRAERHKLYQQAFETANNYNIVRSLQKTKTLDVFDTIRFGATGAQAYVHDIITKEHLTFSYKPETKVNNNYPFITDEYVGGYGGVGGYQVYYTHENIYELLDNAGHQHAMLKRTADKTLFNAKHIVVDIDINTDIASGDVVELKTPAVGGEERLDDAGFYLIKKLRHALSPVSGATHLELSTDGHI